MSRACILVRRIHLWLGFTLGLLFVLIGLTGSALVFYVDIDAALHPAIHSDPVDPAPGWDSPVWDRMLATAREQWPDPGGKWSIEVTGEGGAIPARYYPAHQGHGHHAAREMVWFSSDGERVLRSEPWGGYLMSWLYELHMQVLAGEVGGQIVGWSGVAMLVLLVTGMVAWWPRGSWRKALAFKRNAAPIRRLRDWHKLSGVWSMALLFLLVATGVLLSLPDIKQGIFAPDPVPAPHSGASSGQQISVAQALAVARHALPGARLVFIDVPDGGSDAVRIRVQVRGDPHHRFPGSFVFVDQYTSRVLAVHDHRAGGSGAALSGWIRPLHDGSIGGAATRILAILIGFVPAILFATGLLHWLRRRKARGARPLSHRNGIRHSQSR